MVSTSASLLAIHIIGAVARILQVLPPPPPTLPPRHASVRRLTTLPQLGFGSVLIGVAVPLYDLLVSLDDYCRFFDACGLLAAWLAAVRYSQFVGAFGLLQALVGLGFLVGSSRGWVGKKGWVAVVVVDAVAMLCYLADLIVGCSKSSGCGLWA